MAKSSRFVKLDDDVLLEFMYHDQDIEYINDVRIENDNNGSQLKYIDTVDGDISKSRFLIHELGEDVVEFTVTIANGFVVINNFAARALLLKNGNTYKFNLGSNTINNPSGFNIPNGNGSLNGDIYTYIPLTNGKYAYTYTDQNNAIFTGGEVQVSDRTSTLFSVPFAETGNDVRTAPGQSGRYYALPTNLAGKFALLDNSFGYLDSNLNGTNPEGWQGTPSGSLQIVDGGDVEAVWYDTIRLHLRTGYSFSARGYDGFLFQTKVKRISGVYNFLNSTVYKNSSNFEIQNPNPFILAESAYSKYIEIKVPSLVELFSPATNEEFKNTFFGSGNNSVLPSVNYEFDFKLISKVITEGDNEFIDVVEGKSLVLPQEDEFTNISVNVEHAADGDYFIIYGTFNGDQALFENYITGRISNSGDDIILFYEVQVAEQLGLNYVSTFNNTFTQTEAYDEAIVFRPVIINSSISSNFLLTVNMRIYNTTNNTQIIKTASLIYAQPKKYGKKLLKLNLNSNFAPSVIYNTLPNSSVNRELNQFVNSIRPSVGETKYVPVALDTYRILAGSTLVSINGSEISDVSPIEFKGKGEETIFLSKVSDNFIKFKIAQPDGDSMKTISLVNAEDILLIIKSGTIEQRISHDPGFPGIDLGIGEFIFKVTKSVASRFDEKDANVSPDKFYINIKNGSTESLLYYGKVMIV